MEKIQEGTEHVMRNEEVKQKYYFRKYISTELHNRKKVACYKSLILKGKIRQYDICFGINCILFNNRLQTNITHKITHNPPPTGSH